MSNEETNPRLTAHDHDVLQLVERFLAGEESAFEELVRCNEAYIYRICLKITGNSEDAEDALQDAFVNAYLHLDQFRREATFRTWLTRIAVNEALQRLRKRKRERLLELVDEDDSLVQDLTRWPSNPEQLFSDDELQKTLEDAIVGLPDGYRVVFVLRDICHLSAPEAAEILNLKIPALKSRLLRARLMVREHLAKIFKEYPRWKLHLLQARRVIHKLAERFCNALGIKI